MEFTTPIMTDSMIDIPIQQEPYPQTGYGSCCIGIYGYETCKTAAICLLMKIAELLRIDSIDKPQ